MRWCDVDLGFATEHRFSFKTNLTERGYPDAARVDRFYEQLTARLEALPGTMSIGAISYLPLSGEGQSVGGGAGARAGGGEPRRSPGRLGHRPRTLLRDDGHHAGGRAALLDGDDRPGSPAVAIVDDVLARRLWTNEAAAIGQRVRFGAGPRARRAPSSASSTTSATSGPAGSRCRWPTRRSRRSTSAGCTR